MRLIESRVEFGANHVLAIDGPRRRPSLKTATSHRALIALLGGGMATFAIPASAADIDVGSSQALVDAINNAAANDTITFTQSFALSANLPQISKDLRIDGAGFTLDGNSQYRAFAVMGGTVDIENLSIVQTVAQGGNGGNSYTTNGKWGGGGGGGAGLGGGVFVAAGANVALTSVAFSMDRAVGGAGGAKSGSGATNPGGGGGGGMFGNGSDAGSNSHGGVGGPGGGGGGGDSGVSSSTDPTVGGFGGAGGGGPYGDHIGADGGFGAGGGGGGNYQQQRGGGVGGWGASAGSNFTGGNGAGLGGAVFVQEGGTLTLGGTLAVASNSVTGGVNGTTGPGLGAGAGFFLQGNGSLAFDPGASLEQTVSDVIADQTGTGEYGGGGSWSIVKNGAGKTILTGANIYTGGTIISDGVLQGNTTSLRGAITDNASLVFNQASNGSTASNISGTGSVTKTGAGTLTATGALTYAGGTTVNQGVVLFGGSSFPTGALLVDGGAVGNAAGVTTPFSKAVAVGPSVGSGFYSAPGTNLDVTGVVTGQELTTVGGGDVTLLNNNNDFTAANITSGVLRFNTDGNLGKPGGLISLRNGGAVGTTSTASNATIARQINLVSNGGINVLNQNDSLTWAGVISGAGQLTKSGTGTLYLTGANINTGGTIVSEGTLRVASDSALGLSTSGVQLVTLAGGKFRASDNFTSGRSFAFSGNASIAVDPSKKLTLSGALVGGAFTKDDTGTLELTGGPGANTYSGVTITGGKVMGSAGSFSGFTKFEGGVNSVSLNFNEAPNTAGSYAGVISGVGSVLKTGAGTTTLTGANTYSGGTTVDEGVLKGTTIGLQGNIVDNAEVDFDETIAGVYSGVISGGGVVGVSGSGSVKLTGENAYTGLTRVSGGGTLLLGSSTVLGTRTSVEIDDGRVGVDSGTGVNLSRPVALTGAKNSLYAAQGAAMTVSGVVSGGNILKKTGAGDVTLAADNNMNGVAVLAGRILFTTDANLGKPGSEVFLANGVFALTPAAANGLTIGRQLTVGTGGIEVDKKLLNWSGPILRGNLTKLGDGQLQLSGGNNYNSLTISAGAVLVDSAAELPKGTISIENGTLRATDNIVVTGVQVVTDNPAATISVDGGKKLTLQSPISGLGYLTKDGPGLLDLNGPSLLPNVITILDGTLVGNTASWSENKSILFGPTSNTPTLIFNQTADGAYGGVITGDGTLIKEGAGALTLSGSESNQTLFTGPIIIGAGKLIANSFSVKTNNIANVGTLVFDQPNISDKNQQIYSGSVAGSGSLIKQGPGRLSITGTSTFGAGITVEAGNLAVNGPTTSLPFVTVLSGATLSGNTKVKTNDLDVREGGHFSPGNSIGTFTVEGNATISGTAEMEVAADGTNDQIIVTGSAPLGHLTLSGDTLRAIFLPGLYSPRTYHLMSATSGITGDVDNFETEDLPPNFIPFAFNTENDVYLKLTAALGFEQPLSVNQQAIVNPINTIYNATGVLPSNFANLYGLSGAQLTSALDQTTGEVATGARQTSVQMTNQFLSLMLDPFVDGRAGTAGFDAPPVLGMTSAPTTSSLSYAPNDALPTHKAPMLAPVVEPHWTAWASAYGGASHVSGDPWGVGSHSLDASAGGGAAGLDYHLSPATVLGFAMGGAGGHWSLANGLGSGNTTALQVGIYGATHWGPAYIGGALSFTNSWASTNRNAVGENLKADFDAQSYGARVETGYRFATPFGAVTPYVAGQAQSFHSPGYAEQGFFLNSFALGYGSLTDANERSELGLRFDRVTPMGDMTIAFRGRLAWAHDWFSNPSIGATFIDVPGAGFVVAGATPSRDLALISAGLDLQLAKGVSLQAKFDTELGSHSTVYAGTGTLAYSF